MKILTVTGLLCLYLLLHSSAMKPVTLHLQHPEHKAISRHTLGVSHKKLIIHHNMRVFNHQKTEHLSHQSTSSEDYPLNDMGYFFSLNLTVAGLPYRLNIDTGSSDIFIKGENSPGYPTQKYSCPTCLNKNKKIHLGYMDGFLNTYKANLQVQLGQHVFNESILVAYTAPKTFENAEGLVGLSFPQLARNRDPTFIQTLINNRIISQYAFGVNLNFQEHGRSRISFGPPDPELYTGQFKKYKIGYGSSYTVPKAGISFGNEVHPEFIMSSIFDTGTTCISIPNRFTSKILQAFSVDNNLCNFDVQPETPQFSLLRCRVRNFDSLPTLNVYVQGDRYPIDKHAYIQRCVKGDDGDLCDTYIESVKNAGDTLFLGDGFFSRYYTYFDVGRREIGVASNKEQLSFKNMYKDSSDLDDEDKAFFAALK